MCVCLGERGLGVGTADMIVVCCDVIVVLSCDSCVVMCCDVM